MQIANNYARTVFNGDIGFITEIDHDDGEMTIDIAGRPVVYRKAVATTCMALKAGGAGPSCGIRSLRSRRALRSSERRCLRWHH
jgi:hypothetical protein